MLEGTGCAATAAGGRSLPIWRPALGRRLLRSRLLSKVPLSWLSDALAGCAVSGRGCRAGGSGTRGLHPDVRRDHRRHTGPPAGRRLHGGLHHPAGRRRRRPGRPGRHPNASTAGVTGPALRAATNHGLRTAVFTAAAGIALTTLAALGLTPRRKAPPTRTTGVSHRPGRVRRGRWRRRRGRDGGRRPQGTPTGRTASRPARWPGPG